MSSSSTNGWCHPFSYLLSKNTSIHPTCLVDLFGTSTGKIYHRRMVWDSFLKPDSRQVRLEDQEVSKDQEEFCLRKNPPKTNGWFTWFQDAETKFGGISPFSREGSPVHFTGEADTSRSPATRTWSSISGVIKLLIFGGIKQCKCMVILRDFPFYWCIVWLGEIMTPWIFSKSLVCVLDAVVWWMIWSGQMDFQLFFQVRTWWHHFLEG